MNVINSADVQDNSLFTIINADFQAYNDEGKDRMDKAENSNTIQYAFNDSIISVNRHFLNNASLNDIIKTYIIEEKNNLTLSNSLEKCYNSDNNMTVVDFSERGSK